jgi:hypothetical protein
MDDLVKAAMVKWPNVPDCYGWLGLDARGQWWMRDDNVQAAGSFAASFESSFDSNSERLQSRGALLKHEKLVEFIGRNYAVDARGCGYFQNGPQRVFVELEYLPWVWRLEQDLRVMSHTGSVVTIERWLQDPQGRLVGRAECGWGVMHSQDVVRFVETLGLETIVRATPAQWPPDEHYCISPEALNKRQKA